MKTRILTFLTALMLLCTSAQATILPASGVDEDFLAWTDIECTPAVILCQSLSVLDNRGDQGGKKVATLRYSGETIPVIESWDGYARIYYEDGTKTGWVHNEYLLMDPAWYICDEDVQVYAYPDAMAPRVAYLDKGAKLPIILEYADDRSAWACVSLRGAAGWIRKTPKDTVNQTWFRPDMLRDIVFAEMSFPYTTGAMIAFNDEANLSLLEEILVNANDLGGTVAGCPFSAVLTIELADGQEIELEVATDSCCVYRVDGRDYQYARHLWTPDEGSPENSVLFDLFCAMPQGDWAEDWDEDWEAYPGNG